MSYLNIGEIKFLFGVSLKGFSETTTLQLGFLPVNKLFSLIDIVTMHYKVLFRG